MLLVILKSFRSGFLILALVFLLFPQGRDFGQQDVEIEIPVVKGKDKKAIVKSIKILTKNLRNKNWGNVYEMLMKYPSENQTEEDFIKEMQEDANNSKSYLVTGFQADEEKTFLVLNDEVLGKKINIVGCVEVEIKNKKYRYTGTINVGWQNNKWLFYALPILDPYFVEQRSPC
jgi:hypothetical protein